MAARVVRVTLVRSARAPSSVNAEGTACELPCGTDEASGVRFKPRSLSCDPVTEGAWNAWGARGSDVGTSGQQRSDAARHIRVSGIDQQSESDLTTQTAVLIAQCVAKANPCDSCDFRDYAMNRATGGDDRTKCHITCLPGRLPAGYTFQLTTRWRFRRPAAGLPPAVLPPGALCVLQLS